MIEPQRQFVGKKGEFAPVGGRTAVVYDIATGQAHRVWPVDARQMVASGAFSESAPVPAEETAPSNTTEAAPAQKPKAAKASKAEK